MVEKASGNSARGEPTSFLCVLHKDGNLELNDDRTLLLCVIAVYPEENHSRKGL